MIYYNSHGMSVLTFFPRYLLWHYTTALLDGARAASNLFWFLAHFFSLELILKTFFVPWKRLGESQGSLIGRLIVNGMMRIIGIAMRLLVFVCAAVLFVVLTAAVLVAFVLWIALPVILIVLLVVGIRALTV